MGGWRRAVASRAVLVAAAVVAGGGFASASTRALPPAIVGCWERSLRVGTAAGVWLMKIDSGGVLSGFRPGATGCNMKPDFTSTLSGSGSRLAIGTLPMCATKALYSWRAAANSLTLQAKTETCAARKLLLGGVWKRIAPKKEPPPPVSNTVHVVVPPGQPVQIAFALDSGYAGTPSLAHAIQMAVDRHGGVLGFPIRINAVDAATCNNSVNPVSAATTAAYRITANLQNAAVLGQVCSPGFAQALAIYQKANMVVVSGSATNTALPAAGPTVFDRTIVDDNNVEAWYPVISQLPVDLAWRLDYTVEFGAPPSEFADLYYDATNIVLGDIAEAARLDASGNLILDRAALAAAVRHTSGYAGVTCSLTIDSSGNRVDDGQALAACAG